MRGGGQLLVLLVLKMAACMLKGTDFLAQANLVQIKVEPRASSWLFALLVSVKSALDSPNQPSLKDRLLDYWCRFKISLVMRPWALHSWGTEAQEDVNQAMVWWYSLHDVPTQGARRSSQPAGFTPTGGWRSSNVYVFAAW